jgi:hypothetical protein
MLFADFAVRYNSNVLVAEVEIFVLCGRRDVMIINVTALYRNYVKFLIDRRGHPVKRFKPSFDPLNFEDDVRLLLAGKDPLPAICATKPGKKVCKVDKLLI